MARKAGAKGDSPQQRPTPTAPLETVAGWPSTWPLLVFSGFAAACILVYWRALAGTFISDDIHYLLDNPYTSALTAQNLAAILDPWGEAKLYVVNYAPLHLLLCALERHVFGSGVTGYHLVNVLVHALNATLLVRLLLESRVPRLGALVGGAVFALHPANVEAVAWMSQLKTGAAMALALAALVAQRGRPGLATALFALALLSKASASFALPMAATFTWARRGTAGGSSRHWAWLGAWSAILAVYALPQLDAFRHGGAVDVAAFEQPWVQLRTVAAVGARYLAMAATSYGVSAFQEPAPALSPLDPWWLAALPAGALLAWRLLVTLRRRSEEAAWWVGAAAAFVPISQLFPFRIPMADRYLYFILPGLIGGTLLWWTGWRARVGGERGRARLLALAVAAGLVLLGVHSAARARLWRNETLLLVDAARHYPEGATAHYLEGRSSAQVGDARAAVVHLRTAAERGLDDYLLFKRDPVLAPIRGDPAFRALLRELAGRRLELARERRHGTQWELRIMAQAHAERGEDAQARELLERALEVGGRFEAAVRADLEALGAR